MAYHDVVSMGWDPETHTLQIIYKIGTPHPEYGYKLELQTEFITFYPHLTKINSEHIVEKEHENHETEKHD